ncbi:MAG: aspartate/glutamate racemase family protein [Pseudomonadales bacterium]|nr:aspartate/glutamate racemase family protein [Pseudomonadales bacterium]
MKTVGLLGGMSWESTVGYYQLINQRVKEKLGGLNSAQIVLYSVNFDPIEKLQHQGDWVSTAEILSDAAKKIESAGADFLLICTNTMHKVYDEISSSIGIPILHIADATAESLKAKGIKKVGLLGTKFTMEEEFYKNRLDTLHGIAVIVPNELDREIIHKVIYNELCLGEVKADSKREYLRVVSSLSEEGADAVILGCTEIGLLISQNDTQVPLVDTTKIHAELAVEKMI